MSKLYLNGPGLARADIPPGEDACRHFLRSCFLSEPEEGQESARQSRRSGARPAWPAEAMAKDLNELLPGLNLRRVSAASRLALLAAGRALLAAGLVLPLPQAVAPRCGLYIGTAFGASESTMAFMDSILEGGAALASPTHFSHSVSNVFCGMLSAYLNIQGPACTVCQFGLSFAGAMQTACQALESGVVDLALAGSVEQHSQGLDDSAAAGRAGQFAVPEQDSAVFFVLSRQKRPGSLVLSGLQWRAAQLAEEALPAGMLRIGGRAGKAQAQDLLRPYAGELQEQALDLAVACHLLDDRTGCGGNIGQKAFSGVECLRVETNFPFAAAIGLHRD